MFILQCKGGLYVGGVGEINVRFKSVYRFVSKINCGLNVTQFSYEYIVEEYRAQLT